MDVTGGRMNREEYQEKYNEDHSKCINCDEWDNLCHCVVCDVDGCDNVFLDMDKELPICYDCRHDVLLSECCGSKALFAIGYAHGIYHNISNNNYTGICFACKEHADFS